MRAPIIKLDRRAKSLEIRLDADFLLSKLTTPLYIALSACLLRNEVQRPIAVLRKLRRNSSIPLFTTVPYHAAGSQKISKT